MPMPNEQKVETRLPSAPILANPILCLQFNTFIHAFAINILKEQGAE